MSTVAITGLTAGSTVASNDVLVYVDVSDTTQSPSGTTKKLTSTVLFSQIAVPVVVTSASAAAFTVGLTGATNPAFTVDASTAVQAAGLKVTGAIAAGTVAVVVTSSGANANLTLNAKGSGTIGIGSVSTGRVTITPAVTLAGTLTAAAATFSGDVAVASGQKLFLDGGSNTYLIESSADSVSVFVGGVAKMTINATACAIASGYLALDGGLAIGGGAGPTNGIQFGTGAPGVLSDGQIWYDGTDLKARLGGSTKTITVS